MNILFRLFVVSIFLTLSTSAYAQWQQCNGPYGGNVTALTAQGDILYATIEDYSTSAGIYKSTNNGKIWSKFGHASSDCVIAFDSVVIVGGEFIYRTINDGKNWDIVYHDNGHYVSELIRVQSFVFAISDVLLVSPDKGATWEQRIISYKGKKQFIHSIVVRDSTLFIGTDDGIFQSIDMGINWLPLCLNGKTVSCLYLTNQYLYSGTTKGELFKVNISNNQFEQIDFTFNRDWLTCIIKYNSQLIVSTFSSGIFNSSDDGLTWDFQNNNFQGLRINKLQLNKGELLAGTNCAGVFKFDNQLNSWYQSSTGLGRLVVSSFLSKSDTLLCSTFGGGVFRSIDNGMNWVMCDLSIKDCGRWTLVSYGTKVIATSDNGYIFTSSDAGRTWSSFRDSVIHPGYRIYGHNSALYSFARLGEVSQSYDGGKHWEVAWNSPELNNRSFSSMAIVDSVLLLGDRNNGVYRSTDKGKTWLSKNPQTPYPATINLYIHNDIVLLRTDVGNYRSSNLGFSWSELDKNIVNREIHGYCSSDNKLYITTGDSKVFQSSDNGITWKQFTVVPGLIPLSITHHGAYLFICTQDSGLLRYDLTTDIPEQPSISGTHVRCYPNPANDELTISLTSTIELQQPLQYSITNILGTSVLQWQQMERECTIPIHTLPSGVYYVTVAPSGVHATTMFSVVR